MTVGNLYSYPRRVHQFLSSRVCEFKAGVICMMCPLGLGLTKAKKGCKECLLVKTHTGKRPHTRTETSDFLYYCSLLNILEFSNFLWGKKGFETIKCFEEIKSTKTFFFFSFFPPSTDSVFCSFPNANYNKW
uniref:Uncharacterized protein n=1 Tax=Pipistrellus kuhlii TaxID=59472 RepID=A0A7J7T0X3_PIPKU|nr:hypothetical protein mPipKuh1_009736 [Pipistrellus kuhlii]